jgi:hypothetical protein
VLNKGVATAFDSSFWATQLLSRIGCLSSLIFFIFCSATPGKFWGKNIQSATPAYYSLFPSNKMLFPFHTALLTVHLIKLWKFRSSEMLSFVLAWIIPDASKVLSAFIFRVKQSKKTGWLDSERKGTTKRRELFTQEKSLTSQKTLIFSSTAVRTSNVAQVYAYFTWCT